jgi:hypothetical protein
VERGKEMKASFFCNICRCFFDELKSDNDEIGRVQDKEWECATNNIRQSHLQEEEWKLKKEAQTLVQIKHPPFILSGLRRFFAILYLLTPSKWISGTKKHQAMVRRNNFRPYRCIDIYVIVWLAFEFVALVYLFIVDTVLHRPIGSVELVVFIVLIIFFCYRLFDVFQSWVGQFVLKSNWNAIIINRSLVLAIIGYIEITLIGAIIRFISQQPISCWHSLYGSVTAMIANPTEKCGSPILYTQLMFAILFLVAVAQHLLGRLSNKGD